MEIIEEIVSDKEFKFYKDLPKIPSTYVAYVTVYPNVDLRPRSSLYSMDVCRFDPSLPSIKFTGKVMIAAILYNNESLMPHWIAELLNLIATLGRENVYVSIVESGSQDETAIWLMWLQRFLIALDIPHFVVTNGPGRVDRLRIRHLARLRNLAMAPLEMGINDHDWMEWEFFKRFTVQNVTRTAHDVEKVLWLNDVYWCTDEALRLLAHDVDIACGTDYDREGGKWHFYDGWVARDAGGNLVAGNLDLHAPRFFTHILSDNRWKRGLPVQMASCWNGMAAMNAEGFRQGATFSAGSDGIDCRAASEERICGEFVVLGFHRIIMDPSVRVTYERPVENDLYSAASLPPYTSWEEISRAENYITFDANVGKQRLCCPIVISDDNLARDEFVRGPDYGKPEQNCCRLPVWPDRLLERGGTTWDSRTWKARLRSVLVSSLQVIGRDPRTSSEKALQSMSELQTLLDGEETTTSKVAKLYQDVSTTLRDYGNHTCNGRFISNDKEASDVTKSDLKRFSRTVNMAVNVI